MYHRSAALGTIFVRDFLIYPKIQCLMLFSIVGSLLLILVDACNSTRPILSRHGEWMNDNIFLLALAGSFAGGFGLAVGLWILTNSPTRVKSALRWLWLQVKRPFRWSAAEIKEWRRVSGFRHRIIKWEDLPQKSKDGVSFHDLTASARGSIKLSDLPRSEKQDLLTMLILPEIDGGHFAGELHRLAANNHPEFTRKVHLVVNKADRKVRVDQDGMELSFDIVFTSRQDEIPCQPGTRLFFDAGQWGMVGKVERHNELDQLSHRILAKITKFYYESLFIFDELNSPPRPGA